MDNCQVYVMALKTLKQRCEHLQERLKAVEEENCKLKLEMTQDFNREMSKDSNSWEERVLILNEEKSQLTNRIQMILKENYTLWSHLSKVFPGSNIPSLKFTVSGDRDSAPLKLSHVENSSYDSNKESLEEISLKLINGIIMGKNELEKQYSQMIDLHKENVFEEGSSFLSRMIDSRAATKNLKEYVQKLKDFKQTLYKQKSDLSSAINILKNSKTFKRDSANLKDGPVNQNKESHVNNQGDFEFSTLQNSEVVENRDENMDSSNICPMCGRVFITKFENFYQHVKAHFDDEDDEFVEISNNLEGIP